MVISLLDFIGGVVSTTIAPDVELDDCPVKSYPADKHTMYNLSYSGLLKHDIKRGRANFEIKQTTNIVGCVLTKLGP